MIVFLGSLVVLFLIAAIALLRSAKSRWQQAGLPSGRVIYADTGAWSRCQCSLFSRKYLLTGKPDYLVEEKGRIIPVEVKSTATPSAPYLSHVLQLAAYCLLVEEEHGQAPPYGIISYPHRTFAVNYTPQLRDQLLATLAEMRLLLDADDVPPSHANPNRCRHCGYWMHCEERLA